MPGLSSRHYIGGDWRFRTRRPIHTGHGAELSRAIVARRGHAARVLFYRVAAI